MYSIVYYKLGLGPFAALAATGFICMYYSFVITPVNHSLAAVSYCPFLHLLCTINLLEVLHVIVNKEVKHDIWFCETRTTQHHIKIENPGYHFGIHRRKPRVSGIAAFGGNRPKERHVQDLLARGTPAPAPQHPIHRHPIQTA
ncbi:hypothetical protein BC827DRAFT_1123653 [Russula dissimulans]|nr:hypothetical protein BC827DRAFT_1123653 [Russula dissimulans]